MAPSNPGSPAGAGGGRPQSPSVSGSNSNSSSNGAGKGKGILTASTPASSSEGNTLASINPVDPLGCAAAPGSSSTGSGSTAEGAAAAGSAPVSAPSTVALHQLVTGCKVFVERPAPEEPRKAEILSIRQRKPPRPPRNKDGTLARPPPEEAPKPILEYYIHYVEFNKRLDEWVSSSRLLLSRPVEWPVPKGDGAHSSHGHGPASAGHGSSTPTPPQQKRPAKAGDQGLRKTAIKQAASKAGQQGQKTPASDKKDKRKKKLTGAAATAKATKAAGVTGTPGTSGTATPARSGSIGEDGDDSMFTMNIDSPSTRSVSVNLDRESSADVQEGTTPKEGTPDVEDSSMALDEDGDDAQQAKQEEVDENDESKDDAGGAVIAVEVMDENEDGEDDVDPNEVAGPTHLEKQATFSKEQEIEQLRTHGSMTQSVHEVSRVKNLDKIQMGAHEVEAWYFSPYPVEYAHIPTLYICEFCLLFYGSPKQLERHRKKCTLLHPPGNEIYRHEEISFYEIDGKKQKTWCRNLCLLSKCFLDHKTLYYDVDPFLFYVMAKRDDQGVHLIGYFSKEKESAENYNVACILTLPQHQRHGYGKLLIEFSYELSKKEQRTGSPEKPLSDLGLLSYRAYWQEIIVDFILEMKGKGIDTVSIDDIANKTAILQADIMHTAQTLQMLKFYQNQYVLCLSDALIEQSERIKKKKRRRINPEALVWTPPKFSKAQLNFGY